MSNILRWFLLSVALVVLTACVGGNSYNNVITGYVVDDPVAGVTVDIYDYQDNLLQRELNATNVDGYFNINVDGTFSKVEISKDNTLLYSLKVGDLKDGMIISPLLLLKKELGEDYPTNRAAHLKMLDVLKELVAYNGEDPIRLNSIVQNANKLFLAEELKSTYHDNNHSYKCFETGEIYPLHLTCFSDQTVTWAINNEIQKSGDFFSCEISRDSDIKITWNDGYFENFRIDKFYEVEKKVTNITPGTEYNISIGGVQLFIPENAFVHDTQLDVSLLGYNSNIDTEPEFAVKVTPSNELEIAQNPVMITMPLSDRMFALAQEGRLKILKTDKLGETLLDPIVDYTNKTATVKVSSFSTYKPVKASFNPGYTTFVDALNVTIGWFNTNYQKTFYDVLFDNADAEMKKVLELIKNKELNLSDVMNTTFGKNNITLTASLFTLYKQLVDIDNNYGEGYPSYIDMMYQLYGYDSIYDTILKDTLDSLGEFMKLNEDVTLDYGLDMSLTMGSTTYEVPLSNIMPDIEIYKKYKNLYDHYFVTPLEVFKNVLATYRDPWNSAIQGVEALTWIESMYMSLPSIPGIVFNAHSEDQTSALRNTIATVKRYGNQLYNADIHRLMEYIVNNIGAPSSDIDNWWEQILNINLVDVPTSYLSFDLDKKTLICGSEIVEIDKYDFLLMYMLYKRYNAAYIAEEKDFVHKSIQAVLQLVELRMKKGSKNIVAITYPYQADSNQRVTVDNWGHIKEHFYIINDSPFLRIQPQESYSLRDVNIIIENAENDKVMALSFSQIGDSGLVINGESLDVALNEEMGLRVTIQANLYKDNKLVMPFSYENTIELTKLDSRISISRSDAYANMLFAFPKFLIDEYGKAYLYIKNEGDLKQYGTVYYNADFDFIVNGEKVLRKNFSGNVYNGFNTRFPLGILTPEEITLLAQATSLDVNVTASFSFNDPKIETSLLIDKNDYGTLCFNIDAFENKFVSSAYVFEIEENYIFGSDGSGITSLSFTKKYKDVLNDNTVTGILEVWRNGEKIYSKITTLYFYRDNGLGDKVPSDTSVVELDSDLILKMNEDGRYLVKFTTMGSISQKEIIVGDVESNIIREVSDIESLGDDVFYGEKFRFTAWLNRVPQKIVLRSENGSEYVIYEEGVTDTNGLIASSRIQTRFTVPFYTVDSEHPGDPTFRIYPSRDALTWEIEFYIDKTTEMQYKSFTLEVTDEEGNVENVTKQYVVQPEETIRIESATIETFDETDTSVTYKIVVDTNTGIDWLELESSYESTQYTIINEGKVIDSLPEFISYVRTFSSVPGTSSLVEIVFVVNKAEDPQHKWFVIKVSGNKSNTVDFAQKTVVYDVPAL